MNPDEVHNIDELVRDALDQLPRPGRPGVAHIAVVVRQRPEPGEAAPGTLLLGLFRGIANARWVAGYPVATRRGRACRIHPHRVRGVEEVAPRVLKVLGHEVGRPRPQRGPAAPTAAVLAHLQVGPGRLSTVDAANSRVQAEMESPLALYRRYRPETFAEVIGQDHVTEPLRAALADNRVNHAYLFSGPRGCGKTTSRPDPGPRAQLRAGAGRRPVRRVRLAAATWPAAGPGSIDVIEIDAASHGGVDDARDLREKAFFAPGPQPLQGLHHRRGPHGHARRASTPCSSWSRSRRRTCASSSPPPSRRR